MNKHLRGPPGFFQQRRIHPGDLTGMTEPCGALPRKCLFIYFESTSGEVIGVKAHPAVPITSLHQP
jgi:hypothetical protein